NHARARRHPGVLGTTAGRRAQARATVRSRGRRPCLPESLILPQWFRVGDAGPVPGQQKRRRRQKEAMRKITARTAPEVGHWEVIFETQDESEWHAHIRHLRAEKGQIDWEMTRIDMSCGRLVQTTTYRLSLFVPDSVRVAGRDHL